MGIITRHKRSHSFVVADTKPLNRNDISWKAKGILMYLLSKPEDWQIYINELTKNSTDGKDSTRSGVKELMDKGYIWRQQSKSSNGQFSGYDYWVSEEPVADNPFTVESLMENSPLPNIEVTKDRNKPSLGETEDFEEELAPTEENLSFGQDDDRLKRPGHSEDNKGIPYQPTDALAALQLYYSWEGKFEEIKNKLS